MTNLQLRRRPLAGRLISTFNIAVAYLKTVLTYNLPAEAEVDKAFLESHGVTVCLLNANTSRNELGAPFYIQLQVADDEYGQAVGLLKEANPSRFGSQARVDEIDREIKRGAGLFFIGAIPLAIIVLLVTPAPVYKYGVPVGTRQAGDVRPIVATLGGVLGGILAVVIGRKRQPKHPAEPVSPTRNGSP